jgi:hypothetical protein
MAEQLPDDFEFPEPTPTSRGRRIEDRAERVAIATPGATYKGRKRRYRLIWAHNNKEIMTADTRSELVSERAKRPNTIIEGYLA